MSDFQPDDSEANNTFKAFLDDLLGQSKLTTPAAAAKINISSKRMHYYRNHGMPHSLPAYIIPLWTRMIGPEVLQHLAHEAGYAVAELPSGLPDWKDAVQLAASLTRECGELLTLFAKTVEDESVTLRDLRQVERAVQKTIAAVLAVQLVTETMATYLPKRPDERR